MDDLFRMYCISESGTIFKQPKYHKQLQNMPPSGANVWHWTTADHHRDPTQRVEADTVHDQLL